MPDWTTYKGLEVPYATPSGEAGLNLKNDLTGLADRAPFNSTSDPTTSDDEDDGFFAGSEWLNTSTQTMWVCVDATSGSAKWRSLYRRIENAIVLAPEAAVGGSDNRALQLDEDGDDRGTDAIDFQRTRSFSPQVASGNHSFIAGGRDNVSSGTCSHAEGDNCTAVGYASHAEGFGTLAGGPSSHAEGRYTTANGGYGSHAEGYFVMSTGNYGAHAEGSATAAGGESSHAEGNTTSAYGSAAHAEGLSSSASGNYSHAGGILSKAHLRAQWARAAGGHSSQLGTAQTSITQLFRSTSGATATELTLDGGSAASGNRFNIAAGQTLSCIVNIVGRKASGGSNDHASFIRQVCIRNTSGTTALVDTVKPIGTDINPASWGGVNVTADDTNDSLKIEVTGLASTNIRWMATVIASEVADSGI